MATLQVKFFNGNIFNLPSDTKVYRIFSDYSGEVFDIMDLADLKEIGTLEEISVTPEKEFCWFYVPSVDGLSGEACTLYRSKKC